MAKAAGIRIDFMESPFYRAEWRSGREFPESMENEKSDDQNGNGNTEKPEKSVFHPIYSCNHLFGLYISWKSAQNSLGNYSEWITRGLPPSCAARRRKQAAASLLDEHSRRPIGSRRDLGCILDVYSERKSRMVFGWLVTSDRILDLYHGAGPRLCKAPDVVPPSRRSGTTTGGGWNLRRFDRVSFC